MLTEMAGTLGMFWICLLFAGVHVTLGTTVNIPKDEYKIARGDTVTIPCSFTPGQSIMSISWTAEADVQGGAEIKVVDYFTADKKMMVFKKYKGRASVVVDTVIGTANLQLQSVTSADTRSYECKVQDTNDEDGNLSDTVKLIVLVAPSTPICAIEGTAEYFQNINLTCRSDEGTPTPTYKWQSYSVSNVLQALPPKATDKNGLLSLVNISKDTSGYYICTSTNEIRSATCNLTLSVMPASMNMGSIAIIGGAVAGAVALLGLIVICCCCRNRNKQNEEYAMGTAEEFTDKDPDGREDDHTEYVNHEEEHRVKSTDKRDPPDDRSERSYDRRSDYDRRDQYTDKRDDRSDRHERYDRDDRRDRYDDGRDRYDDRRENYDDRRDRYDDRRDRDRYDDRRGRDRYDDRRDRDRYDDRYDSDRYSDRYDSRDRPPSVPLNKPKEQRN